MLKDGMLVCFAYKHQGKGRLALGPFDVERQCGLSLQQARGEAAALSQIYCTGDTDIHAHGEHQVAQSVAAREAKRAEAVRELELAQSGSPKRLHELYLEYLESAGKVSARNARYALSKPGRGGAGSAATGAVSRGAANPSVASAEAYDVDLIARRMSTSAVPAR
jgi:hypothetical protein